MPCPDIWLSVTYNNHQSITGFVDALFSTRYVPAIIRGIYEFYLYQALLFKAYDEIKYKQCDLTDSRELTSTVKFQNLTFYDIHCIKMIYFKIFTM